MNTQSIKANHVPTMDDVRNPGDFAYSPDFKTMFLLLPGERFPVAGIRIVRGSAEYDHTEHPRWIWDGNIESPTLTPSIHCPGVWHGYLTNGEFKSC